MVTNWYLSIHAEDIGIGTSDNFFVALHLLMNCFPKAMIKLMLKIKGQCSIKYWISIMFFNYITCIF